MNVRKVKEIIKFDVEKSIQNKWFVILNVLTFIIILIATNWSHISQFLDDHDINIVSSEEFTIQVVDNENLVIGDIEEAFKDNENIKVEKVDSNPYSKENIPEDDVILVEVKSDSKKIINIKMVSKEGVDGYTYDTLYDTLKESRNKIFANIHDITVEDLEVLSEDLNLTREMLGVDVENADTKEMIKLISTVVMYMCLLIVLGRIANEIANEKVSKSIEYVLTSVSAKEYLLAKVLSSTITIVIQLIYTVIYYMIGNMIASLFVPVVTGTGEVVSLNIVGNLDKSIISYVLAMIGYLIFTVFLTTLIQAALSSKTTSIAEAGNTTMLLVLVVVALYIISISLINPWTKVTTLMYIISCIPIVSTFFIPSMMIIGQATTAQIIISFIVLILSIPLVFNFCAKVFKNGILDYTSKKKGLFAAKKKNVKDEMSLREKQDIELRKSRAKKFAFSIGMAMILFVVLETVCSLVLGFTLPTYLNGKFDLSTILVIENSLILIISLGLSSAFIKFYTTEDFKKESKKLSGKQKFEIIFIGIAIIALIQLAINILYPQVGIDEDLIDAVGLVPQKTFGGIIIFITGMALVPAIFEELLFRKWILNSSKKYGKLFAVVFSAALFGLYHMNLSQGIFAFFIGLLFGVIAIKTETIKYTCLLHFLNNTYACLGMILGTDSIGFQLIFDIVIAIAVVGAILIFKNLQNLKKINQDDFKLNKDCKYLLRNYTFILSMILIVVMFAATEHMIS